jgi:hypothetical protein
MATEYILWGFNAQRGYPFDIPLALTGGNLRHCRAEQAYRKGLGWTVGIYAKGDAPTGLRLLAEKAAA